MSLKLSKNNAPVYDYYSEGDGSDPVSVAVTLDGDGTPATIDSNVITAYLVATVFKYTGIVVQPVTEDAGVNWQVSLDNVVWAESVAPADMDALAADQVTTIYLKAVTDNDGSVATSIKTGCDVQITRTENPE